MKPEESVPTAAAAATAAPSGVANETSQAGAEKTPKEGAFVLPRFKIFYSNSFVKKCGLPKTHICNKLQPASQENAAHLAHFMVNREHGDDDFGVGASTNDKSADKKRSARRKRKVEQHLVRICEVILKRHKKFDYTRTLERSCPLPKAIKKSKSGKAGKDVPLEELVQFNSDHAQVKDFVKATLSSILPAELFGTEANAKIIIDNALRFCCIRRQEQMSITDCVSGVKVSFSFARREGRARMGRSAARF